MSVPSPPKRPLSSFLKFSQTKRDSVIRSNPNLRLTDISKKLTEMWNRISSKEKESYKRGYAKAMDKYKKEYDNYMRRLTDGQKQTLQAEKCAKKELKKKRENKKLSREFQKPKRPQSSFTLFVKDNWQRTGGDADAKITERMKGLGSNWQTLSSKDKKMYEELAAGERAKYNAKLQVWEKKMIKQGHVSLVRQASQPKKEKEPKRDNKRSKSRH